jgi:hypothetical protein
MAISLATLATEINTDPKTLGYTGKSDSQIADLLNTPGASAETIFKAYTDTPDVVACIVRAEWTALAAGDKQFLAEVILAAARVKTGDANLRAAVAGVFANGTTSRANLIAAASKAASRAEALFGEGVTVSHQDVAQALRG